MAKMLKQNDSRLAIGITLLLIGTLFLLDNVGFFGLLPASVRGFVMDWRNFFFYAGVIFLFAKKDKMPGIVLILLGILFYLKNMFGFLNQGLGMLTEPIVLIAAGIIFVILGRKK